MIIASQNMMMSGQSFVQKQMTSVTVTKREAFSSFEDLAKTMSGAQETKQIENVSSAEQKNKPERVKMEVLTQLLRWMFVSRNSLNVGMDKVTTESHFSYQETQEASFSTEGRVVTSDGREISFSVDVSMSQSFTQTMFTQEFGMVPTMCDPLVINMDADYAEVTDQKFYFDLDCDGEKEALSTLAAGSGFLALDKNGDGIINDGSELFGPTLGNGFVDLSQYDLDGNGWIDEADDVFERLEIWIPNADGSSTCYKLKDKGIGAICLQNVGTDYSLKNEKNETNGIIRSTGVYLMENGRAGTIQHLDLAM